jgi:hypothetical protein
MIALCVNFGTQTMMRCYATGSEELSLGDFEKTKPDWCPLRELPEKKDTLTTLECHSNGKWTEGMKAGYNACLDEIVKNCKNS